MPKVIINSSTSRSPQEAFEKISSLLENDKELHKLDANYSCNFDSTSLTGSATGSQFKALLKVSEKSSGADVEIVVELPFHLALAKGLVQKTLQRKMDEALG